MVAVGQLDRARDHPVEHHSVHLAAAVVVASVVAVHSVVRAGHPSGRVADDTRLTSATVPLEDYHAQELVGDR